MKICIIGAGISGLSVAKILSKNHEITLLEKTKIAGGIARPKIVQGISYHTTGGHCFNSKFPDVLDFVFNEVLPIDEWNKIKRKSSIRFKDIEVPYPIEYSVKEIYKSYPDLATRIIEDFINTDENTEPSNLKEWFINKFGSTLAKEYFIPYNSKIWGRDPVTMSHDWVSEKLPIPNKNSFIKSFFETEADKMPHSEFYYPKTNSQIKFIEELAKGTNIIYNYKVNEILKKSNSKFLINKTLEFDRIISTIPLNVLPEIIKDCPSDILELKNKLHYNKITTALWESRETENTWTYIPSEQTYFHRYIHIGNFFEPKTNHTITEIVGEVSREQLIKEGKKDDFLINLIDNNVSEHAYVVYDENIKEVKSKLFKYFEFLGIDLLGRFAQWDYFNMDVCIKQSINLAKKINKECDV
jgi:protoporphyrinogen oxidase